MTASERLPAPGALETTALRARALGHPARLRILALLEGREICACQITAIIDLAPATISAHLRQLRLAGLVEQTRRGRWIWLRQASSPDATEWIRLALGAVEGDPVIVADRRLLEKAARPGSGEGCAIHPLAPPEAPDP